MSLIKAIHIQNIPKREKEGIALKKLITRSLEKANLSIPIRICQDVEMKGTYFGLKACLTEALKHHKDEHGYVLVCQDDITFPRNAIGFINHVVSEANKVYELPYINMFSFKKQVMDTGFESGHHVYATRTNMTGQLNAIPLGIIEDFIRYTEILRPINGMDSGDDIRLVKYHMAIKKDFYRVIPNPVQHLGAHRSSVGIGGFVGAMERVSNYYFPDYDYMAVDWVDEFTNPYKYNVTMTKDEVVEIEEAYEKFLKGGQDA